MGSRKRADFAPFSDWLESDQYFSPSSAYTYSSHVRRVFRDCPQITTEHLDSFLEEQRYAAPLRAAWKKFGEWATTRGVEVPSPSPSSTLGSGKLRIECSIPDEVCDDLIEIASSSHLSLKKLASLEWGAVVKHVRNGAWEVASPDEPGTYYRVPIKPMERLEAWAHPQTPEATDPLVPLAPGSSEAMPYRILTRILATRKRTRSPR